MCVTVCLLELKRAGIAISDVTKGIIRLINAIILANICATSRLDQVLSRGVEAGLLYVAQVKRGFYAIDAF